MISADDHVQRVRELVLNARSAQRQLAPRVEALFTETLTSLDTLGDSLLQLQQVVVLTDTSIDDLDMAGANAVWADLPADKDCREIKPLVSASPTLSTLHRAGIDVRAVRKYGEAALKVAAAVGTSSGKHPQYARQLLEPVPRRTASDQVPVNHFHIRRDAAPGMATMLRELTALKVCSGFDLMGRMQTSTGKKWIEFAKVPPGTEVFEWRVYRGTVDPGYQDFLRGHWLTAYAYQIALDQFDRTDRPFEIYSNLEYQLPGEMGGGRSDIDVLVRTADQLMMIECKAGRVLTVHQNKAPLDKVIHNASKLDQVLTDMDVDLVRNYLLVHVGFESDRQIAEGLEARAGGLTSPVMPHGLRARIAKLASPHGR